MARELWDCWNDPSTPETTGSTGTSGSPPSGSPEEVICYPPRIDHMSISPSVQVQMFIE